MKRTIHVEKINGRRYILSVDENLFSLSARFE